jgi:hypothetical protein
MKIKKLEFQKPGIGGGRKREERREGKRDRREKG